MASHKHGFITGSTCSAILTGKGDTLLTGGVSFCEQIAEERFEGIQLDEGFAGNDATEWGNMHEDEAIARYEALKFVTVKDKQKPFESGWLSCTPDGIAGTTLIEVKCPYTNSAYREYMRNPEKFVAKYNDQVQFNMMLTGCVNADLIAYNPKYPEPLDILVVRVQADPRWVERFEARYDQAEAVISDFIEFLNSIKTERIVEL